MRYLWVFAVALMAAEAQALEWSPDSDLYIRVVDVGPGLCTVTVAPGGHVMVYDAGWRGHCIKAVRELVPADGEIDLLVISHSDGDHLGDAAEILEEFSVTRILHTGFDRSDAVGWREMMEEIADEDTEASKKIDLGESSIDPGTEFELGEATATFVAGWHEWTETDLPTQSEFRNAISIVIRLDFEGHSVLFTGDTVGRRIGDPNSACKDAEKIMVDNADTVSIAAEVVTAAHHGADNGNSNCFIRAIDPTFVIFSAGHDHEHPRQATADRYIANGVSEENLFRTDKGDNEGDDEWVFGALRGCSDKAGDDDVDIVISADGVAVDYRTPRRGC